MAFLEQRNGQKRREKGEMVAKTWDKEALMS